MTGFNLLRNDGNGGSLTTYVNQSFIANKPSLTQYKDIFLPTDTGKQFRYRLQVLNAESITSSTVNSFILADVPNKPNVLPWKVVGNSDSTSLNIMIQPFTQNQTGGSMITSYQI